MSSTTASGITKGKRSRLVSEGTFDSLESNISSLHDTPPPQKRQRVTSQLAEQSTLVKQGEYKYEKALGFMDLPVDVFLAITPYLSPSDIISLARTNKSLRRLIMDPSSALIWSQSMKNVQGIPPCPAEVSVPSYMAFLFMNECSFCGNNAIEVIDTSSVVRLCQSCNARQVNTLSSIGHHDNWFWAVLKSELQLSQVQNALRRNFQSTLAQHLDLVKSSDNVALWAWVQSKRVAVVERHRQLWKIRDFLHESGSQALHEREFAISRRLEYRRWGHIVMNFSDPEFLWKWFTFLQQPVPRTNEGWTEFLEEVIRFLEANRRNVPQGTIEFCLGFPQ